MIFISYQRSDTPHVTGRIYDTLTRHFGEEYVFYDVDSIPFGVDFRKHLDGEVSQRYGFLVMIGSTWLNTQNKQGNRRLDDTAEYVRIERESAFKRNVPVIPILVGAAMPKAEELPDSIRGLAFRNGMKLESETLPTRGHASGGDHWAQLEPLKRHRHAPSSPPGSEPLHFRHAL